MGGELTTRGKAGKSVFKGGKGGVLIIWLFKSVFKDILILKVFLKKRKRIC
jgi:hypothetical protein